jgi:hypothetical protein
VFARMIIMKISKLIAILKEYEYPNKENCEIYFEFEILYDNQSILKYIHEKPKHLAARKIANDGIDGN